MTKKAAKCHCGSVSFEIVFDGEFEDVRHCNCPFCKRRSAYVASVAISDLEITKGVDNLSLYTWGTGTAKHYFCKTCGIYTHHQRRSNPNEYGINIACFDDVDPFSYGQVPVYDGVNHSKDTGKDADVVYGENKKDR